MSRGVIVVMAFLILSSCKVHDIAKREDTIGKSKIQILELGYPFKYSIDRKGRYCLTDRTREGREVFIFKMIPV